LHGLSFIGANPPQKEEGHQKDENKTSPKKCGIRWRRVFSWQSRYRTRHKVNPHEYEDTPTMRVAQ